MTIVTEDAKPYVRRGLEDPEPARGYILENLEACQTTLSKLMLSRFSKAGGPVDAIVYDLLDAMNWNQNEAFRYGQPYCGGKALHEVSAYDAIDWRNSTRAGVIEFLQDYMQEQPDALIVSFNCVESRSHDVTYHWRESKRVYFAEDVYHIVAGSHPTFDDLECMLREAGCNIMIGTCSAFPQMLSGDINSIQVFESIAANTKHVFSEAFDGEAYLVWTPQ